MASLKERERRAESDFAANPQTLNPGIDQSTLVDFTTDSGEIIRVGEPLHTAIVNAEFLHIGEDAERRKKGLKAIDRPAGTIKSGSINTQNEKFGLMNTILTTGEVPRANLSPQQLQAKFVEGQAISQKEQMRGRGERSTRLRAGRRGTQRTTSDIPDALEAESGSLLGGKITLGA